MDWSHAEVEAVVADYLNMLTLELSGQTYNKAQHRRQLQRMLNNRSEGSIEFKHGNISAVMTELGIPYLKGYVPRSNYQAMLADVVAQQIRGRPSLDQAALAAVQHPAMLPTVEDFARVKEDAPAREHRASEAAVKRSLRAFKRDYLEREAANSSLGLAGEEFVVQYEHWRLVELGRPRLAERVEHVSKTRGDGLGFDVLSFDLDGRERLIEVKTTSFGKETPFFVSSGEVALSEQAKDQFHLYRLFEFRRRPRLFDLAGKLQQNCNLDPVTYRASFG